jgi:hypothetical protein
VILAKNTVYKDSLIQLEQKYSTIMAANNQQQVTAIRDQYKSILKKALPGDDVNDTNFIFLRFVVDTLQKAW